MRAPSALAGYETVNWGKKTLYDGARLNNGDAFVYCCAATLDMEVYLADFIALTASLRERFPVGRQHGGVPYGVRDRCQVHHQLTDAYGLRSDESQCKRAQCKLVCKLPSAA